MRGREINLFRDIRGVCACIGVCLMCLNTTMVTVQSFSEVGNMELGIGFRGRECSLCKHENLSSNY